MIEKKTFFIFGERARFSISFSPISTTRSRKMVFDRFMDLAMLVI